MDKTIVALFCLQHYFLHESISHEQSVLMANELKKKVDHEFVTMAGKGHGFDVAMWDQDVSVAFLKVIEFLNTHLKGGI